MTIYGKETVTSLYVKTENGDILFLCIGRIGKRVANMIKRHQDDIGREAIMFHEEKLDSFSVDTRGFDIKIAMVLTDSAEQIMHKKFREIADQCRKLNIISMLFFAFEAEYNSKYPMNDDYERCVDGTMLEAIIQLSARYFNFTHCDYVHRELSRTTKYLTPGKALAREGNIIARRLSYNEDAYFLVEGAIDMHDYWWDISY